MLVQADHQPTNNWARPDEVRPQSFKVEMSGSGAACTTPAGVLVSVEIDLV